VFDYDCQQFQYETIDLGVLLTSVSANTRSCFSAFCACSTTKKDWAARLLPLFAVRFDCRRSDAIHGSLAC
jgi:hypothetical protein